jgi:hypothetical protein
MIQRRTRPRPADKEVHRPHSGSDMPRQPARTGRARLAGQQDTGGFPGRASRTGSCPGGRGSASRLQTPRGRAQTAARPDADTAVLGQ